MKGYDVIIVALLKRVGGYLSIPLSEQKMQQGTPTYHVEVKSDGTMHLWLPGKNKGDR